MRTNRDLQTTPFDDLDVASFDFVGYWHPREIVADPLLTVSRKRELLAHWLSDANAVRNAPAIRRSPAGVTTTVADLRTAREHLEEMVEAFALAGNGSRLSGIAE